MMRATSTPIWWPLRLWMGVEVLFGLAAIGTIFLFPEQTATNFAWPINPAVMAATLGAFYTAAALIFVLPLFARTWQRVRPMILPTAAFSTVMLLATLLHWDKFSVGTRPFYVWFASYLLPPPIFALLYWWHQRRAAPVGAERSDPLPQAAQRFLAINGVAVAGVAGLLFLLPSLLASVAPWAVTPLTTRTLCGWLIGVGLLQVSMAWENDWQRIRLASTMLIALPVWLALQLLRFSDQVQWANVALWVLLADSVATALLLLALWVSRGRRDVSAAHTAQP
jgi:hypothetical protein